MLKMTAIRVNASLQSNQKTVHCFSDRLWTNFVDQLNNSGFQLIFIIETAAMLVDPVL